jgi:molybdenum cofactor cytidylyltransferase
MRVQVIDVSKSIGRILYCTIFRTDGKKLLAKGHVIGEEDAGLLETEGVKEIWVAQLEDGEVGEDQAVLEVAREIGCGSLDVQSAAGGRANLLATEPCCTLVDDALLKQINRAGGIAIATPLNFSYAGAGQRVATVKSTPFAVAKFQLDAVLSIIKERGPVLRARPIRSPVVAVLYSDPLLGERARQLFESVVRQRLDRFRATPSLVLSAVEEQGALARSLEHLLRAKPAVVLIASTVAPAGPDDAVGRAMVSAGCQIEHFLAPVEPGSLLLLGYQDDIPVMSAPGCFRSAKPNVLDLLLPPMLAGYRVSGWEVACLGHGGLLN